MFIKAGLIASAPAQRAATLEDNLIVSTKLNIVLRYNLAITLLSIYPTDLEIMSTHLHANVYSGFIYNY